MEVQTRVGTFFLFLIEFYFSTFVFTLIFQKNVPKLVLFLSYQGVWGLQHTFKSALQPLVFKHFIGIRCYVTNVAYCYAHSLGDFFATQKPFVCLKEAPKQTLCSLLTSDMLDIASNSVLKTSCTISDTSGADTRKW